MKAKLTGSILMLIISIAFIMTMVTSCSKSSTGTTVITPTSYTSVTSVGTGTSIPSPKTDLNGSGYMGSAVVNGNIYLGGGDSVYAFPSTPAASVEVYNVNANTWTTANYISPATDGIAIGSLGGKVFFAGGYVGTSGASTVVNIYDSSTNSWSKANLSVARFGFAVGTAGTKVVFAGGSTYNTGVFNFNETPTNAVDIYDINTKTWTTSQLPEPKNFFAAASLGTKIVFAGGFNGTGYSSQADIYDVSTNTWTTAQLSQPRAFFVGAAAGNLIMFAGGEITGYFPTSTVDIYNISTGAWTTDNLSVARASLAATSVGNLVFFGGGQGFGGSGIPLTTASTTSATVDIYNTTTGKWLPSMQLSVARYLLAAASSGDKVIFAGGLGTGPIKNTVDIFKAQ